MRISCCVFVVSLIGVGNYVLAQPIATDFSLPVQPVSGYYDANPFLSVYQGKYHMGEDWNGNRKGSSDYGDPFYPIGTGKVVKISDITKKDPVGKVIVVKHLLPDDQVIYSCYFHSSKILVKVNQIVYPNQPIGQIGDANGYYKGQPHLHLEVRRVNQTISSSYAPTLLIATEQKYLDPSLFIDDRADSVTISASGTFTASDEDFVVPNYAPASLAYVTKGNKILSLASAVTAGWLDSVAYARNNSDSQWESIALTDLVFGPDIDFQIKFLQSCTLTVVVPGHNFQTSRARDDMIHTAQDAGFTRIKLETLTDIGDDGIFDLRSLCFDHGLNTNVLCTVHATNRERPLERWVMWYDPVKKITLGDWVALNTNDIN